jgi:hypothetical protein
LIPFWFAGYLRISIEQEVKDYCGTSLKDFV